MLYARLVRYNGCTPLRWFSASSIRGSVARIVWMQHGCRTFSTDIQNDKTWTIPNIITCSRIVASPLLAAAVVYDMKGLALTGCILAGVSDWADGYIARKYNQSVCKIHLLRV